MEFRQLSAAGIKYADHENQLCIVPSHPHERPIPVKRKPVSVHVNSLVGLNQLRMEINVIYIYQCDVFNLSNMQIQISVVNRYHILCIQI